MIFYQLSFSPQQTVHCRRAQSSCQHTQIHSSLLRRSIEQKRKRTSVNSGWWMVKPVQQGRSAKRAIKISGLNLIMASQLFKLECQNCFCLRQQQKNNNNFWFAPHCCKSRVLSWPSMYKSKCTVLPSYTKPSIIENYIWCVCLTHKCIWKITHKLQIIWNGFIWHWILTNNPPGVRVASDIRGVGIGEVNSPLQMSVNSINILEPCRN